GVEKGLQPALEQLVHRRDAGTPEEAVVDEQQPGLLGGGQGEQLRVRGDAGRDRRDLPRSRHLQPVHAVVLEATRLQDLVELADDLPQRHRHGPKISLWNTPWRVGAWRSLVARTVRVGEVPSSNLGAPIKWETAKFREQLPNGRSRKQWRCAGGYG